MTIVGHRLIFVIGWNNLELIKLNRFESILVLLVPIVSLFCVAILPLMPFLNYEIKFSLSWLLVLGSFVLTVVLLAKKKYSFGDIIKILLGAIFSLAGFVFAIWTVFLWYNMAAILFEVGLSIVGIILSLILLRLKPTGESYLEPYGQTESGYEIATPISTNSPGFLRIYREPILYFVFFMIVGIIGMVIYRPQSLMSDPLYTVAIGAAFGLLGACCFVGSGRTKFVRK